MTELDNGGPLVFAAADDFAEMLLSGQGSLLDIASRRVLGIGESSKIAILVWVAFRPVLLNTLAGVKQKPFAASP